MIYVTAPPGATTADSASPFGNPGGVYHCAHFAAYAATLPAGTRGTINPPLGPEF